jgi:hypothetical protein
MLVLLLVGKFMMIEQDFYKAIGVTDFLERYYSLCKRYSQYVSSPCQYSKRDVVEILSEMGRTPSWDARDKSYSFDRDIQQGKLHIGFVIQGRTTLEFWFWLEGPNDPVGENFAVIAHTATKFAGKKIPDPPYPRPLFHNLNELRLILAECFKLADMLLAIMTR